ncbi:MAG: hypothetical protein RMM30_08870 [Armatimonadota bacterium]|nr:hypothetical protein [Armatimonadota bacterium]MDW8156680.1 hypothetical protein [Armatimonadota bacterium]
MTAARELLDRVVRSVREGATSVARESERLARLARVRLEIGTLQARLEERYTDIGRVVHARYRAGTLQDPELSALCQPAEVLESEIRRLEGELAELRSAEAARGAPEDRPGGS